MLKVLKANSLAFPFIKLIPKAHKGHSYTYKLLVKHRNGESRQLYTTRCCVTEGLKGHVPSFQGPHSSGVCLRRLEISSKIQFMIMS